MLKRRGPLSSHFLSHRKGLCLWAYYATYWRNAGSEERSILIRSCWIPL